MLRLILLIAVVVGFVYGEHEKEHKKEHEHGNEHRTTTQSPDHFLVMLQAMHKSTSFRHLPNSEQVLMVELIAAAETNHVASFVEQAGLPRVQDFINHVKAINQREGDLLDQYLTRELNAETHNQQAVGRKRDLQKVLLHAQQNPAVQKLPQEDQTLLYNLIRAAESHNVTPLVQRTGYARIIKLIEDISTVSETHDFINYLVRHMNQESGHHH